MPGDSSGDACAGRGCGRIALTVCKDQGTISGMRQMMAEPHEEIGKLDAPDSDHISRQHLVGFVPAKAVAVRRGQQLRAAECCSRSGWASARRSLT